MRKSILLISLLISNMANAAQWEKIKDPESLRNAYRLSVEGGWLVTISGYYESSVTFVPDAQHKWKP